MTPDDAEQAASQNLADPSLSKDAITESIDEESISLEKRFFNIRTLISFLIAFAIVGFIVMRMDIDLGQTWANILRADKWHFALAVVAFYLSFPVRAYRWRIVLGNVGLTKDTVGLPSLAGLLEIIMLSWFANCVVPAKLGDAYRGYLLKRSTGVSFMTTMGTILAERIVDMLVLFGLLALAGLQMFRGKVPQEVMYILLAGVVLVFVIVAALVIIKLFSDKVERRLPARFAPVYARFSQATLLSFRKLPAIGVLTIVVWGLEATRFWAVCQSLGITEIGISAVFFLALATSLLTTLPITPAGLGVVESAVIGVLLLLGNLGVVQGVDLNMATSVSILDRVIGYWSLIGVGLVIFLISRKK